MVVEGLRHERKWPCAVVCAEPRAGARLRFRRRARPGETTERRAPSAVGRWLIGLAVGSCMEVARAGGVAFAPLSRGRRRAGASASWPRCVGAGRVLVGERNVRGDLASTATLALSCSGKWIRR